MTTVLARLVRPRSLMLVPLLALMSTLALTRPAAAQLARVSDRNRVLGLGVLGTDVGFDPTTGRYLVVGGAGYIVGVCTNNAGAPVSPMFTIMDGVANYGHYPRVR